MFMYNNAQPLGPSRYPTQQPMNMLAYQNRMGVRPNNQLLGSFYNQMATSYEQQRPQRPNFAGLGQRLYDNMQSNFDNWDDSLIAARRATPENFTPRVFSGGVFTDPIGTFANAFGRQGFLQSQDPQERAMQMMRQAQQRAALPSYEGQFGF